MPEGGARCCIGVGQRPMTNATTIASWRPPSANPCPHVTATHALHAHLPLFPAHEGKSYILNKLLGAAGAAGFEVASSYRPCTKGGPPGSGSGLRGPGCGVVFGSFGSLQWAFGSGGSWGRAWLGMADQLNSCLVQAMGPCAWDVGDASNLRWPPGLVRHADMLTARLRLCPLQSMRWRVL